MREKIKVIVKYCKGLEMILLGNVFVYFVFVYGIFNLNWLVKIFVRWNFVSVNIFVWMYFI